jgi:3-oxoacyl-[acyl-carrier-protein] synthase II
MILDIAAGQISMRHGFRGPNFAVVSACASSTNGMIAAVDNIRLGKADIILSRRIRSGDQHGRCGRFSMP